MDTDKEEQRSSKWCCNWWNSCFYSVGVSPTLSVQEAIVEIEDMCTDEATKANMLRSPTPSLLEAIAQIDSMYAMEANTRGAASMEPETEVTSQRSPSPTPSIIAAITRIDAVCERAAKKPTVIPEATEGPPSPPPLLPDTSDTSATVQRTEKRPFFETLPQLPKTDISDPNKIVIVAEVHREWSPDCMRKPICPSEIVGYISSDEEKEDWSTSSKLPTLDGAETPTLRDSEYQDERMRAVYAPPAILTNEQKTASRWKS